MQVFWLPSRVKVTRKVLLLLLFKIPLIFGVLEWETHHCIFVANHVEKGGERRENIIVVKMTRWLFLDFWRLDWQNEFCKIRWRENCKFGSHLGSNGRITAIHLSQKEVFKRYWDRLLCNNYNPMFYITSLHLTPPCCIFTANSITYTLYNKLI